MLSKSFGEIFSLLSNKKYNIPTIEYLNQYFEKDNFFMNDFIKFLTHVNSMNDIFDFSELIKYNKKIFSEISLSDFLKINKTSGKRSIIKSYIESSEDLDFITINENVDISSDMELLKLIIDKDYNNISKININNMDMYLYAVEKGYILTKDDVIKNPGLLDNDKVIESITINNKDLISLISKDAQIDKMTKNGYIFEYDDIKNNSALVTNDILTTSINSDVKCIEFAKYNIDLHIIALRKIISDFTSSYEYCINALNKAINKEEISDDEKQLLNRLDVNSKSETDDFDYNTILDKAVEYYKDGILDLNNAINSLNDNEPSDKYVIDKKYLMNSIVKLSGKIGNNIDILSFQNSFEMLSISKYVNNNKLYSKDFGEELENLYNDPNVILGIHGSRDSVNNEEEIDSFFKKGLANVSGSNINYTVALKTNGMELQDFLGYSYSYNNNPKILLAIPKDGLIPSENPIPIWYKNDDLSFLNPKYIYGSILNHNSKDASILKNSSYLSNVNFENLAFDKSVDNFEMSDSRAR